METIEDLYLVIGDNSEYCAWQGKSIYPVSNLLTSKDLPISFGYYYTSLADVTSTELLDLCLKAKVIHYREPPKWDSIELKNHTTDFLVELVLKYRKKVHNFDVKTDVANSLNLVDIRKIDNPQLWVVGCSFAQGYGLDPCQRYATILSNNLTYPFTDLTWAGSSVEYAADQILRSDIRKNDIVVWGLTGVNRVTYYINNQPVFLNISWVDIWKKIPIAPPYTHEEEKFFSKLCSDDNRLNCVIKSVFQVQNFLKKVGAHLICFNHNLGLLEHEKVLSQYLYTLDEFLPLSSIVDYAPDKEHPGPITNQNWAKEIFSKITDMKLLCK